MPSQKSQLIFKVLNLEQKNAVTHGQGPLLIIAGAGTGKTTVITRRIAWLIAEKLAKPGEILAMMKKILMNSEDFLLKLF